MNTVEAPASIAFRVHPIPPRALAEVSPVFSRAI